MSNDPFPLRYGQIKPYPGIPRINWGHPLAQQLVTYVYDAGGIHLDLVNGGKGVIHRSTNVAVITASPVGTGMKFASTGSANNDFVTMPINAHSPFFRNSAPFSFVVGTFPLATSASQADILTYNNASSSAGLNVQANTSNQWIVNCGFSNVIGGIIVGTFNTCICVCRSTAAFDNYVNGKFVNTVASNGVAAGSATHQVCIANWHPNSLWSGSGINGFMHFHATWTRALTAVEARQIHNDPYCLLIFPEDEIFSAIMAPAAPAVVVTVTGGSTLPMMGVG